MTKNTNIYAKKSNIFVCYGYICILFRIIIQHLNNFEE
jgi:hypothetical protein